MSAKLPTEHHLEFLSLKEGRAGSSKSTLVKMPHCCKSHVSAHMVDGIHFSSPHYQFVHPREEEEGDNSSETVDSLVLLSNNYIGKTCLHKTKLLCQWH